MRTVGSVLLVVAVAVAMAALPVAAADPVSAATFDLQAHWGGRGETTAPYDATRR